MVQRLYSLIALFKNTTGADLHADAYLTKRRNNQYAATADFRVTLHVTVSVYWTEGDSSVSTH